MEAWALKHTEAPLQSATASPNAVSVNEAALGAQLQAGLAEMAQHCLEGHRQAQELLAALLKSATQTPLENGMRYKCSTPIIHNPGSAHCSHTSQAKDITGAGRRRLRQVWSQRLSSRKARTCTRCARR